MSELTLQKTLQKKGQGLPLNTVIIAILVLLVLVILAIVLYSSVYSAKEDVNKTKEGFTKKCAAPGTGRSCSDTPCSGITWGDGEDFTDCREENAAYCCS